MGTKPLDDQLFFGCKFHLFFKLHKNIQKIVNFNVLFHMANVNQLIEIGFEK